MNIAEATLYSHLTDAASLDYIIREGFILDQAQAVIPTEMGRKLIDWAIEWYFRADRLVAPSREAIMATWGEQLAGAGIVIDDQNELDSIQWAVNQLRNNYADYMTEEFVKSMSIDVRNADGPDRAKTVLEYSEILHGISQSLISRRNEMTADDGLRDAIRRYQIIADEGFKYDGMQMGLPEIDDHIRGIHPGELSVWAGTSGGGKSWLTLILLLAEFTRGRRGVLYTLENDLEMTFDRLACVQTRIPYEKWQRGECADHEVERVRAFADQIAQSEVKPVIIHPMSHEATGAAMVRRALTEGADSIIIDQLTHIQPPAKHKGGDRKSIVAATVKDLNILISEGTKKVPLALMHQINRKGREDARKNGKYEMSHMGEATEVENEADFIFALFQNENHVIMEEAELQMLKGRRVKKKDFELTWRPAVGDVKVLQVKED